MAVPQGFVLAQTPIAQSAVGGKSQAAGAGGSANIALTGVTLAGSNQRFLMQRLIMQCSVAPTANGIISIKDSSGGTVIFSIEATTTMVAGQQPFNFPFDAPLRTKDDPTLAGGIAFVIDMAANTGTWRFFVVGFAADAAALS